MSPYHKAPEEALREGARQDPEVGLQQEVVRTAVLLDHSRKERSLEVKQVPRLGMNEKAQPLESDGVVVNHRIHQHTSIYDPRDLRSFPRWERRVKLWQRRVAQWLTPGEAGLFLLESLTGQAELETEHVSLDRAAQPDGVDYLLSTLRNPLGEKSLYLKRLYLQEWENIGRQQNESVRSYLNRFRRVMLDLQSQEVGLESAFSSESVGFRLLERCRLAPDQQRVVLVGSNQSFQYESIRESMLLQFPEGKAPPPLYGVPNQQRQPMNQQVNTKGGKSSGKFHRPRAAAVHAAEHEEDPNDPAEDQAEEEENEEEEDDDVDQLAEELQEALTVTSDKLKAITQGRRYNKPPKSAGKGKTSKTSSDKPPDKSRDRCRICNQLGHWHKECPNNKGNGKGGKPSGQRSVHVAEELVEEEENQHDSFFVYMASREEPGKTIYRAPEVCLASAKSSGGYMITDTACQRLCHGKGWIEQHEGLLFQSLGLRTSRIEGQETFKFGAGKPQVATSQVRIPAELGGQSVVLYSSELDLGIPLLGSLTLLDFLGATICLPKGIVYFERLGVSVPLVRLDNGHAAVEILPLVDRFRKSHTCPKGCKEIALNPDQEKQRADSQQEVELSQGGFTHSLPLPTKEVSTEVCFGSSNAPRSLELPSKVWSADYVPPTAARNISGLEKSGPEVGVPTNGPPPDMCKVNEVGASGSTNGPDLRCTESGQATQGVGRGGRSLPTGRATTFGEVPARECKEKRKSPRVIRSMPKSGVQPKDALRPRRPSLAGVLLAVAAAITTSLSGPSATGSGEEFRSEPWLWDNPEVFTSASSRTAQEEEQATIGVRYQLRGKSDDLGRGGRDSSGRVSGFGRQSSISLKQGERIRLSAKAAKSARLLTMERDTTNAELERARQTRVQHSYLSDLLEMDLSPPGESLHVHHDPQQKAHFAEMFAGEAKPTKLASKYGLRPTEPAELRTGWDLGTVEGARKWKKTIQEEKPLVVVIQYPCRYWSRLINTNYSHRPEEFQELRAKESAMFDLMLWTIREQTRQGRYWLLENPQGSDLWKEPRVAEQLEAFNATAVIAESGAFGGTNSKGQRILKRYQFASNHEWLVEPLAKRLTPEERKQCVPLEGKETTYSQVYPERLAHAILRGVRRVVRHHDPTRFQEIPLTKRKTVACGELNGTGHPL